MSLLKSKKVRYGWGYVVHPSRSLKTVVVYNPDRDRVRIVFKTVVTALLAIVLVMGIGYTFGFGLVNSIFLSALVGLMLSLTTYDAYVAADSITLSWSPDKEYEINERVMSALSGDITVVELVKAIKAYKNSSNVLEDVAEADV